MPELARSRLVDINTQLKRHDVLYHGNDTPEISDSEYDELVREKEALLSEFPDLSEHDEYRDVIGSSTMSSRLSKVSHSHPMLSLENAFTVQDIEKFITRAKRHLGMQEADTLEIFCEPKIDGMSFSALYEQGALKRVATRGNGHLGEDITNNALALHDRLPHVLPNVTQTLEVRGEIYMRHDDFEKLKHSYNFANPRNAASGSMRQLDSRVVKERNLRYVAYSLLDTDIETQEGMITQLTQWGFCTNSLFLSTQSLEEALAFYEKIYSMRGELGYDIDGMVYKINTIHAQKVLGATAKYPRWAIAHKFPSTEAKTILKGITVQVGRTGVITPVAELEPINIGGTVVSRASLHNPDEIKRKDIRIGDCVIVKKAGEVIPQISEVDKSARDGKQLETFFFPTHCPSCGSVLQREAGEVAIRCIAELSCKAQILERIEHFVSRDALNIEGFGSKQIEFLFSAGYIENVVSIFSLENILDKTNLETESGWGKKSVENLLNAIRASRTVRLSSLIFALGIRLIGKSASEALSKHYLTYSNWLDAMTSPTFCEENSEFISGIGPGGIASLKTFFSSKENINILKALGHELNILDAVPNASIADSPIANKVVVFTGVLENMTRKDAISKASELGAKVSNSVSKNTDILIVGVNPGSKQRVAEDLKIQIMDEESWMNLVKEYT